MKTYLVTKDIVETLERKVGYELRDGLKERIKELEEEFLCSFWSYIPDNLEKIAIDAYPVSLQLESAARKSSYPLVSLDRVYLTDADEYLEVTRLTNPKTGEVSISARPGNKPLEEQIDALKKYDKIVLADVGAFGGGTLLEICELLEKRGIGIEEIYLGFSGNEAYRKISKSRKLTALYLFDFYEWIELRDLFGIDGRNVGIENGRRLYIPYWENLTGWASVPEEKEGEAAELCKYYYRTILALLKKEGHDIRKIGKTIKYEGVR